MKPTAFNYAEFEKLQAENAELKNQLSEKTEQNECYMQEDCYCSYGERKESEVTP